jgi:hypothetical protein
MKRITLALVLVGVTTFVYAAQNTHDTYFRGAHRVAFGVSAQKVGVDTRVTLTYPDLKNIWVCLTFRKVGEPSYAPRWCFAPANTSSEVFTIPRWPPVPATDAWEFYAILQYISSNGANGYVVTGWQELH